MSTELAIIGAGNMAEAIVRGLLNNGLYKPTQIIASDVAEPRRAIFSSMGIQAVADNAIAANGARILLLSVKPQMMKDALASIAPAVTEQTLIISIAAGKSSRFIEDNLGGEEKWRVIRSMPNTPMLVGEGMVAISPGRHASADDMATARKIFETGAAVIELTEDKIDAVTAMSGSGPAYFFYLVEQMVAAGITLGLSPADSHLLATRTAIGAAKMMTTSADSPQELRRKVTSPGGTTQAAIETMQHRGVGDAIIEAIQRAAERSHELAG